MGNPLKAIFGSPDIPAPTPPPPPEENVQENIDELQRERLRRQRSSGRFATVLSQESQLGRGIDL